MRTTILPEQLDYLYQKYQIESNPSRKMLEQIANEVGLRKRVVQVWFQNTRARERKGQFRAHQQVINKRCPFCPAIFRVRSALESHLATKHADHYTRGEIDIDALPDADGSFHDVNERPTSTPTSMPPLPPLVPTTTDQLHSMQKYYEDTMKRYMNDLQNNSSNNRDEQQPQPQQQPPQHLGETNVSRLSSSALDLTTSTNSQNLTNSVSGNPGGTTIVGPLHPKETETELGPDIYDFDPQSPSSSEKSCNKRFRTQMSTIQIKMMKSVFQWYKTPTMNECSQLGLEIGLPKRVIQVWFQNARAKDKKAKMQIDPNDDGTGQDPLQMCPLCQIPLTESTLPEHLFSSDHLCKVKQAIQSGQLEPQSPGESFCVRQSSQYEENVDANLDFGYPKGVAIANPFLAPFPALFSTSGKKIKSRQCSIISTN